jgi:hypothetical protein
VHYMHQGDRCGEKTLVKIAITTANPLDRAGLINRREMLLVCGRTVLAADCPSCRYDCQCFGLPLAPSRPVACSKLQSQRSLTAPLQKPHSRKIARFDGIGRGCTPARLRPPAVLAAASFAVLVSPASTCCRLSS